MRNQHLLEQIADQIEAEPENWQQADVVVDRLECGTTYCIGGWALQLSGLDPRTSGLDRATTLLGLTFNETHLMFYNGMNHESHPMAHKEVAEWLRGIARGDNVAATAPDWWEE